ncbi:DNA helicase [Tanacetum coccineum]
MEEKCYDGDELAQEVNVLKPKLNAGQRQIYKRVIDVAKEDQQELIFVYDHGGTGKTFLWKVLISSLSSKGKIVLAMASSSIDSLLLPTGRTSHSRFKLPLDLIDDSICNIKKNTRRTLRDIMDVPDKVFGGKSVVLGGDFRQTLPVKKGGSKVEIIAASIAESHLWKHFKVYTLTENMRLQRPDMNDEQRRLTRSFATWLLDVGNYKIGTPELMRYFAFGRHLDDLHVTWAHLEKKRTRLQTNTKTLEDLCSQSLETASQAIHDVVTTHQVTASHISRCHLTGVASCDVHVRGPHKADECKLNNPPEQRNNKCKEKGEDGPEWTIRTIDKSKTPEPEAPTLALTTRSGISIRDPPFPTPPRPPTNSFTKGETKKPEGTKKSFTQEPIPRPSILYQPSKTSNSPFPSRLKKQKKDDEDERLLSIFKQIHINIAFLEAMIRMPKGAKVLKDQLSHKEKLEKATSSVKLILEMDEDELVPIILGRPFLATARAIIDIYKRKLSLRVKNETITFNIEKAIKSKHSLDDYLYYADHTAKLVQEQWVDIVNHDGKWTKEEEEEDPNSALVVSFYPKTEPVEPLERKTPENRLKPSSVEPPELELKELSEHLEYAFLQENNQLPVVISLALSTDEKIDSSRFFEITRGQSLGVSLTSKESTRPFVPKKSSGKTSLNQVSNPKDELTLISKK